MCIAKFIFCVGVFGVSVIPAWVSAAEGTNRKVREAWTRQLDEHAGVAYEATGVKLVWKVGPKGRTVHRTEPEIRVLMQCDKRKFRFDVREAEDNVSTLHILDERTLHTSVAASANAWEVTSNRSFTHDSDILYLYPFLVAHGAVPIPPYEAVHIRTRKQQDAEDIFDLAGHEATFTSAGTMPTSTTVSHNTNGLVQDYVVTRNDQKALVVRNTYRRENDTVRLARFSVILFTDTGNPIGRLDGRVTNWQADAVIPIEAFTPPLPPQEQRRSLIKALQRTAIVEPGMSLHELSNNLQVAFGKNIQVRIDREAFERHPRVRIDRLRFDPGEVSLSRLLFDELRDNHLDFYVAPQGIVILPRSEAWTYAEVTDYSTKDHGLSLDELRNHLY